MKALLIIIACLITCIVHSQKITNNIQKVETLKIYGDSKVVIGQIVINQTLETKIFLLGISQEQDSSGIYTTIIRLGNKDKIPIFGVDIEIDFDTSIISCKGGGMMSHGAGDTLVKSNTVYVYRASQVERYVGSDLAMKFWIKSYTKIKPTIYGIDGKL